MNLFSLVRQSDGALTADKSPSYQAENLILEPQETRRTTSVPAAPSVVQIEWSFTSEFVLEECVVEKGPWGLPSAGVSSVWPGTLDTRLGLVVQLTFSWRHRLAASHPTTDFHVACECVAFGVLRARHWP